MKKEQMTPRAFISILVLLAYLLASSRALAESGTGGYLRHPTGYGNTVVFQFHGALWRYDKGASAASVLSSTSAEDGDPAMSPDGKAVAYVGTKGYEHEVFLVVLESGNVRQLTYNGGINTKVQGWLNATEVLYSTTIKSKKRGALLFTVNTETLAERPIPLTEASEGCMLGDDFIFVKNEELVDSNRGYRGGYAQRIYKITGSALSGDTPVLKQGINSVLLSSTYDGVSRNPVCLGNGRIYFLSDRTGRYSVWSMNGDGDDLVQHTFDGDFDIRSIAALSNKEILYEKLGDIFALNIERNTSKKIEINVPPSYVEKFEQASFNVDDYTDYQVSNNGNTLLIAARGKLWAVEVSSKSARCIMCDSSARVKSPQISSDAKSVIALVDTSGEYDIYKYSLGTHANSKAVAHSIREPLYDMSLSPTDAGILVRTVAGRLFHVSLESGRTREIELESRTRPEDISWSHDGRYAAFVTYSPQDIGKIAVFDTRCGDTRYLTSGENEVTSPVFSADDSQIYYISQSYFRSSVIDTWAPNNYWPAYDNRALIRAVHFQGDSRQDGSCVGSSTRADASRRSPLSRELSIVAGNYNGLLLYGDRLLAYSKREARDNWGHLVSVPDLNDGSRKLPEPVINDAVYDYRSSKDGHALLFRRSGGLMVSSVDSTGRSSDPVEINGISGLEVKIDLSQERQQMFHEAWRLYRDYFWDRNMAGVDWRAVRDKYAKFLQKVSNRAEFNELVSYMISELGTGHTTVGNPIARDPDDGPSIGRLGATLVEDGGLRVVEIYDGDLNVTEERSPLNKVEPIVEAGDRITRVNGFSVAEKIALDRLLQGTIGRKVVITVKKPDGKSIDVRVSPISAGHEAWLRSRHWAWSNRQYVDRASDSKVGYIHLSASYEADLSDFVRQYAYLHEREALIVDLRGNNGGNIDPWILNFLQRRTWLYISDRYDKMALKHPRESFKGNLVVLIDGDTYSDGELIAEGVRRLGLGVLVGTRTSGAGVWVNDDNTLIDGGKVRIPVSGSYVVEQDEPRLVIEGRGVAPDVVVENDPYKFYFGQDAQLELAVEIALKKNMERVTSSRSHVNGHPEPGPPK